MERAKTIATYLLALGLFSLAGAIIYFAVQLANISSALPGILQSIKTTSDKVEPIIKEVGEVRELIPPIVREVSETRKQIPAILAEVKQIREQIPAILEEMEKIRPLIPVVVEEVRTTREALPGLLSRSEKLVKDAGTAGSKASEGAVTGIFKGIIKLPFNIIGGIGNALFNFNNEVANDLKEEDIAELTRLGEEMLQSNTEGESKEWSRQDIGYRGTMTLKKIETLDQRKCKTLSFQLWQESKSVSITETVFCQMQDGAWEERKAEADE